MKLSVISVTVLVFIVVLLVPFSGFAADKKGPYFVVKPGAYIPAGDFHDSGFDTTFAGEVAIVTYYGSKPAFEGGVGYFRSSGSTVGAASTSAEQLSA